MKEIYQQTAEEVLERVESRESGLTDEQVRRSREKCGWNELAEGKKKSILQRITTELCTDYYDEMIDEVNSLLKELEISARISIPKESFLKEDDFVGIDLT